MEFGSVLDRNLTKKIAINQSTTTRFHKMATVKAFPRDAEVILSIFSGTNRGYPFEIKMRERHTICTHAFFPLSEEPWLVVVAPDAGDKPDEKRVQCFRVAGNQGVQYNGLFWRHARDEWRRGGASAEELEEYEWPWIQEYGQGAMDAALNDTEAVYQTSLRRGDTLQSLTSLWRGWNNDLIETRPW